MKPSKRNFLWLVPLAIIGIFFYFYGPQKDITDNEYITFVKSQSLPGENTAPLEELFNESCENLNWLYFKSQGGQAVVEFEGDCQITNEEGKFNIQLLVDKDRTEIKVGAILKNNTQLSDQTKEQLLNSLITY